MPVSTKLSKKIEAFLSTFSKSEGGFAPVGAHDIEQLAGILQDLIKAKYENDPDGDLPVSFHLVDRTRYQTNHFVSIPHLKDNEQNDLQALRRVMRAASCNQSIAQSQMDQALRQLEFGPAEAMEKGLQVSFGKNTYERCLPLTDHSAVSGAARVALDEHLKTNPPNLSASHHDRMAWEQQVAAVVEEAVQSPVSVRAYTSTRNEGKTVVSVDLLGIGKRLQLTLPAVGATDKEAVAG